MEPDEDEYQEQQDSLNVNEQTWRDGTMSTSGNGDKSVDEKEGANDYGMGMSSEKKKEPIPEFSIVDYEKQLALWSSPEFKEKYQEMLDLLHKETAEQEEKDKMGKEEGPLNLIDEIKKEASLPTGKELSERFGVSFAPILERFKEQIILDITSPTATLGIPMKLNDLSLNLSGLFTSAADSVNLQLRDSEKDPSKKVNLEFIRVDINALDVTADTAYKESEVQASVLDSSIVSEKHYNVINEKMQRGLGDKGVVGNPGHDGEWITLNVYDEINERELTIKFIVYLQVRKTK